MLFAQKMKRQKTTIWLALRDGECKGVAATPEALWAIVQSCGWFRPTQEKRWTFVFRTRSLPFTHGTVHDWTREGGSGGIKIHWHCPVCGKPHWSDKSLNEPNPTIWLCEGGGMKPVVIKWKDAKNAE